MSTSSIPGYSYGAANSAISPLTLEDLENLKLAVLFGPQDQQYLQLAGEVLADQVEEVLDVWYGFVASHPHLLYYFTDGQGNVTESIWLPCANASGNGFWIPATVPTTRHGLTISRRSACATSMRRKTRQMGSTPSLRSTIATWSPSSTPSRQP